MLCEIPNLYWARVETTAVGCIYSGMMMISQIILPVILGAVQFRKICLTLMQVLFREDCTADDLIDVILANRVYLPCIYVYNKIDQISIQEVDRIAREPNSVVVRLAKAIVI